MSQNPIRDDFTVRQGTTYADSLSCVDADDLPVPLTGDTLLMHMRATPVALNPLLTLSMTNGGLVVDAAAGVIYRTIADEVSASLPVGTWPYDLFQAQTDGTVNCLAEGFITVVARETRFP